VIKIYYGFVSIVFVMKKSRANLAEDQRCRKQQKVGFM
jgi:hypothetical protein